MQLFEGHLGSIGFPELIENERLCSVTNWNISAAFLESEVVPAHLQQGGLHLMLCQYVGCTQLCVPYLCCRGRKNSPRCGYRIFNMCEECRRGWEQELCGPCGDQPLQRPSGELGSIRESSPVVVNHMDKRSASSSSLVTTEGTVLNFPLYRGPGLQFSYLVGVFQ